MSTPPGPRSVIPFRYLRTLQRDPIPFFAGIARKYGDAAQFHVGPQQIFLFNHPDLIRELLVTQHRSFHKSRVLQRSKIIFGEGLLTSEEAAGVPSGADREIRRGNDRAGGEVGVA
jgi:hypothetical protein